MLVDESLLACLQAVRVVFVDACISLGCMLGPRVVLVDACCVIFIRHVADTMSIIAIHTSVRASNLHRGVCR